MKSNLGHLQCNIDLKNISFYQDLFNFLGWTVLYDTADMLGVACEQGASLWFASVTSDARNDYDGAGMNHMGITVAAQADVDAAAAYLQARGVAALFETPRHRPEFCASPDQTYYQVMFESPDRLLFEIVYMGPLAQ